MKKSVTSKIGILLCALAFLFPGETARGNPAAFCTGVDHPPFEREYSGDGYSYLNVALAFSPGQFSGTTAVGVLEGGAGGFVEAVGELDGDGRLFMSFPLYSYDNYKVSIMDEDGQVVFEGTVEVGPGESKCDKDMIAIAAPSPTPASSPSPAPESTPTETPASSPSPTPDSTPEPSPALSPTPTPESAPTPEAAAAEEPAVEAGGTPDEAGGGPWWPYVLIAIGIAIGAGGIALMRQRGKGEGAKAGGDDAKNEAADEGNAEDDDPRDKPAGAVDLSPCDDRRKIWEAAEQIAKEAQEAAEKAAQIEKEISDRRAGLEAELRDIRKTYPSAGKPGGGRSWAESGGRRLTERDVQMRQEAEWAAWEAYRRNPNPETAEAMQEAMNDLGSPRSEAERRELDERARRLEEELRQARKEEQLAEEALERARRRAEQARNQAEEARYEYELCIGRIRAGAEKAEPPHTGGGEPVTAGDGRGSCSCREDDPPQERNRRDLGLITFPYRVEVKMISGGDAHKAAQEAREISEGLQEVRRCSAGSASPWTSKGSAQPWSAKAPDGK